MVCVYVRVCVVVRFKPLVFCFVSISEILDRGTEGLLCVCLYVCVCVYVG